jgi:predicted transcriptional regulator
MQMEDVIDRMRRDIRVRPVTPNLAQVSFAYEDPVQAQRVSQDLVARIIFTNVNPQLSSGQRIELVTAADQAKRQIEGKVRAALTSLGLPVGLLFGVALALILRRRAPIR